MANPLYNQYGTSNNSNFFNQLIADAQKLRQAIQNPQQEVERLLKTGQMSQSQFNMLAQQANRFLGR